ncbi:MAG: TetR/AcrR family transcriptional regulator [Leptospirales bacterium]|nr:TetR/AcrR family transcriptional regulator [Leptospirales bacterium]
MKKGNDTRERLLATTGALLQKQGYFATGVQEILKTSETPRGSFYFHFPGGKEELACAALQDKAHQWQDFLEERANQAVTLPEALSNVCDALAEAMVRSNYELGCPVATTALEAAATVDSIHRICSDHYATLAEKIASRLRAAGIPESQTAVLSTLVISAVEGALLLSRAHRSPEPLHQVGASLRNLLVMTATPGSKKHF